MTKIPLDDILESLYKLRIRESEKLKTVLELCDLEIHQKKLGPEYHRLKTMVKRSIEQEFDIRTLAPGTEIMKRTPWSRIRGQNSVDPDQKRDHELKRGPTGRRSSNARQMGCVFQDMKPPKSTLRKSSNIRKPIRCVQFTKAIARHTKIRDQNPSLGYICPGEPHQRSPNAPKFEDRSQEETEWQEQGAREAAWKLAKSVFKLKEHQRATFFSPSEKWCLPASNLKPEEREFVVHSFASMHMISKKGIE